MRSALLVGVFALAFLVTAGLSGQDPKGDPKGKDAKADPKVEPKGKEAKSKGQLPQNWSQLGLTADQKELEAKFEALPKKSVDEYKDESLKAAKEQEDLLKAWEKWAKGSIAEHQAAADVTIIAADYPGSLEVGAAQIGEVVGFPLADPVRMAFKPLKIGGHFWFCPFLGTSAADAKRESDPRFRFGH